MQGFPLFLLNQSFPNLLSVDDINVQISEADNKALIDLLNGLSNKDTLLCKVLSFDRDSYTIQANDNVIISAKAEGTQTLEVGSMVLFEVNKSADATFSLRPLNVNTNNIETAKAALKEAHIPVNGRSLELVENLMEYGMPVDKKSLALSYKEVFVNPETPVKNIVDMIKMGIPVSKENLSQFSSYMNMENSVTEAFADISDKFTEYVFDLPDIQAVVSDNPESVPKNLINEIKNAFGLAENESLLPDGKAFVKNIFSETADNFERELEENIKAFTEQKSDKPLDVKTVYKEALIKTFTNRFALEPEEVATKPDIDNLYRRLMSESKELVSVLDKALPKDNPVSTAVNNLSANLDFMNALNTFVPYVQIPFKAWDNPRAGELYVYKNRRNLSSGDSELTAMLHLDTKNLGPVDVFVKLKDNHVTTNFSLRDEECLSFIEKNISLLDKRLTEKGYSFSSEFSVNADERSPFKKMLDEKLTRVYASRTSFDARI